MRWEVEFYHEGRRALARYGVEAATAAEAVRLARAVLVASHPAVKTRRRLSLYEQAQRIGGLHADGWALHRIVSL